MIAQIARLLGFFVPMGAGLWGLVQLPFWWGVGAFIVGFFVGSVLSRAVFKRLASEQQIKEDLTARLFND